MSIVRQADRISGHLDWREPSDHANRLAILRLLAVHEHACSSLHAVPLSLEERLYRFQLTGDWDTFRIVLAANEYTLGQSGLDRYRELVESA